jgi:hypothetical protein
MGVVTMNSDSIAMQDQDRLVYRDGKLIFPSICNNNSKEMKFIIE